MYQIPSICRNSTQEPISINISSYSSSILPTNGDTNILDNALILMWLVVFESSCNLQFSTSLTTTSITIPAAPVGFNWIFSQSESNSGVLRRPVVGMNVSPVNLLASFPKIDTALPSTGTSFTLSRSFTMTSRGFKIGLSAKFNHTAVGGDSARSINYVNTFDIDSLASTGTIKADNSYQNRVGIPSPKLWRTLNWDALTPLTPSVNVAYVE